MRSCHGEMEESGLSLLEHTVSSVALRHFSYPMKDDVKLGLFFLSAKKKSSRRNRMNPKSEKHLPLKYPEKLAVMKKEIL